MVLGYSQKRNSIRNHKKILHLLLEDSNAKRLYQIHSFIRKNKIDFPIEWFWNPEVVKVFERLEEKLRKEIPEAENQEISAIIRSTSHEDNPTLMKFRKMAALMEQYLSRLHSELSLIERVREIPKRKELTQKFQQEKAHEISLLIDQIDKIIEEELKEHVLIIIKKKRLFHLELLGFPVKDLPDLANFLVTHWQDVKEMEKAIGLTMWRFFKYIHFRHSLSIDTSTDLFKIGLVAIKDLINYKTWPVIVKIVKEFGANASLFFEYVARFPSTKLTFKRDLLLDDIDKIIRDIKSLFEDERYTTVEGLSSLGILCCHVTNLFDVGGDRQRAFQSIINCIVKQGKFPLSTSSVKKGVLPGVLITNEYGINGSIGIILDSGYIYEAYQSIARREKTTWGTKSGLVYTTAPKEQRVPHGIAVNTPKGRCNELLVRRWTVGSLFYTKGVQSEVIAKLKEISDKYSFKEYPNPKYISRKIKYGVPRNVVKTFPIYEIDTENNAWRVVYTPSKV